MGMKPLIYSVKEAEKNHMGWSRDGFNISYYQSARKKRQPNSNISGPNSSIQSNTPVNSNIK